MSDHEKIYAKLDEISERIAGIHATCPQREKRLDDHETRLRGMEAVQNKAVGVVAVVSLILGSIGAILTTLIKKAISQ